MSYTPTQWQMGDVITPQKLNKIEQGILNSNSVFRIVKDQVPTGGTSSNDKSITFILKNNFLGFLLINSLDQENQTQTYGLFFIRQLNSSSQFASNQIYKGTNLVVVSPAYDGENSKIRITDKASITNGFEINWIILQGDIIKEGGGNE